MSRIIDFLEKLGSDAQLRDASATKLEEALQREGLEPALRTVLMNGDQSQLESLLQARSNVCCLIYSPDQEEEDEEEESEEDEDDDEDGEVKSLDLVRHRA